MRTTSLLIAASIMFSAGGAAAPRWSARNGRDVKPSFSLTISAKPNVFTVGSPIPVNVLLRNTSSHTISLVELGWCNYKAQIQDSQGTLVRAKAAEKHRDDEAILRHAASNAMKDLVEPGNTAYNVCTIYDLAQDYEVTRPGEYSVRVLRYDDENRIWVRSNTVYIVEHPRPPEQVSVSVEDRTGAAIPRAKVDYRSSEVNDYRYVCTDNSGTTTLDLEPGEYDVRVSYPGFRSSTQHLKVSAGVSQTVKLALEIGSCPQCPMVISLAPVFQITDQSLSVPDPFNEQARFEEVFQYYEDAVRSHPSDAGLHNSLGIAYAKWGRYPQAREEFKKAAELDPAGATHAYFNLGLVSFPPLPLDEEIADFRKSIELDPANAEAYQELGIALMRKANLVKDGRQLAPPEAVDAFKTYLTFRPEGQFAQYVTQIINEALPVIPPDPCAK